MLILLLLRDAGLGKEPQLVDELVALCYEMLILLLLWDAQVGVGKQPWLTSGE